MELIHGILIHTIGESVIRICGFNILLKLVHLWICESILWTCGFNIFLRFVHLWNCESVLWTCGFNMLLGLIHLWNCEVVLWPCGFNMLGLVHLWTRSSNITILTHPVMDLFYVVIEPILWTCHIVVVHCVVLSHHCFRPFFGLVILRTCSFIAQHIVEAVHFLFIVLSKLFTLGLYYRHSFAWPCPF